MVFVDPQRGETLLDGLPADQVTPEKAYERRWALTLLEQVYGRVEAEYANHGKAGLFEALRGTLTRAGDPAGYAALARQLGMSEGAVKVAAHRLRHR